MVVAAIAAAALLPLPHLSRAAAALGLAAFRRRLVAAAAPAARAALAEEALFLVLARSCGKTSKWGPRTHSAGKIESLLED